MPTATTRRRPPAASSRTVTDNKARSSYTGYEHIRSNTAHAYDYAPYPGTAVRKSREVSPQPKSRVHIQEQEKSEVSGAWGSVKQQKKVTLKLFVRVACVFMMCCIMIYGYTAILESNAEISKMTDELTKLESDQQMIQTKIDRAFELGVLEEYAKTKLGMITPDDSQMFYIDMRLGDGTQGVNTDDEGSGIVLNGTPGALVRAIQVLK